MPIKVSIIVPVYNTSQYLINCLSYLVNQTLQEIEIICINDCSTDNSLEILNACKAQFPSKIILIDLKKNVGAGGARNEGLKVARGKYIGFIDSDDQIDPTMFEKLYSKAKENDYDIVDCAYHREENKTNCLVTTEEFCGDLTPNKKSNLITVLGYICTKIFKREILLDNNIFFREHCIYEDIDFLTLAYLAAKSTSAVAEVLYIYRYYQSSSSNITAHKDNYSDLKDLILALYARSKTMHDYPNVKEAIEFQIIWHYGIIVTNFAHSKFPKALEYLTEIRDFIKSIAPNYYNNKFINRVSEQGLSLMKLNDKDPRKLL